MTVIDARVRLPQDRRPHASYGAPARQTEQYDRVLDLTTKMNGGRLVDLVLTLDEEAIDMAVMHAETEGGEAADELNAALAGVIRDHPQRFVGVGAVDIGRGAPPTTAARQVSACAGLGFVGVCLQPAFFGLDIDDRTLYPLYSRAEESGLLVAIHTGINYSRLHPLRHERPEMLDQVACDFPELRIVACHAGWPWVTEMCAVARRHPSVYLEFGAIAPKYVARPGTGWDPLFGMMRNVLRDQVLYGSDWPMMPPKRALTEWRESGLDDRSLEALLHDNAARLLGAAR
jgi:predicted TIM-barrel fold metal-dependent hydrolase